MKKYIHTLFTNINRTEWIIFLTVFFIRAVYAIILQLLFNSDVFISFSDAETYLLIADNMVKYNVFSEAVESPWLLPDPMRTIIYPLFLSIFVLLKAPLLSIVLVQNILAGILAVMIYRLGKKIFSNQLVGIIAALIYSIEPTTIYWTNLLMSDFMSGFLFFCAFYLFVDKKYYWSSFLMGLAALTRPTHLYLFPIFLVMYFILKRHTFLNKKINFSDKWPYFKKLILIIFIFILTISPWMIRNKIRFDTFNLSSNGWMAIHYFISKEFADRQNIPHYWPPIPESYYHGKYREAFYNVEFVNHKFYKDYFLQNFYNYPLDYINFHFISFFKGFFNFDYPYLVNHVLLPEIPNFPKWITSPFLIISKIAVLLMYIFIIFSLFPKKRKWQLFLLSFPLANNFMLGYISLGSGAGRYLTMPYLPFLLLLSSYGFLHTINYIKLQIKKSHIL